MNVRKAKIEDAAGIARVHVDSWRSTYKGVVPEDFLASLSYSAREQLWQKLIPTGGVFVAEQNGEIIGFASAGKERSEDYLHFGGEVSAIYLLEHAQKLGVGKKLMQAATRYLVQQGFKSMLVIVLKDNDAVDFYKALGAQQVDELHIEIGGKPLDELVLGWRSIEEIRW